MQVMPETSFDLQARQAEDLETLQPLHEALLGRGADVHLTRPGEPGRPCAVRVLVAGPAAGSVDSAPPRERTAIVLDALSLPDPLPPELVTAELVLIPGAEQARQLGQRVSGRVEACGLPRLEPLLADPETARLGARRDLGIPAGAQVVLCEPGGELVPALDQIARLAAEGPLVVLLPGAAPRGWIEAQRERASRTPGLALMQQVDALAAVLAADVVCAATEELLAHARLFGRVAVVLDRETSADAVRSALAIGPGPLEPAEILARTAGAAGAMAEHLLALLPATPVGMGAPPRERSASDEVDALIAFGDIDGARRQLEARLQSEPTPELRRRLAALERKAGKIGTARAVIEIAETAARAELSAVLCERARIALDGDQPDEALALFEEAHRVAPGQADALVGLGSIALARGDIATGERRFRQALEREKSARTLAGMGLVLNAQARPRDAIPFFEEALDLELDCLSAVGGLVQAAFQTGELALAERRVAAYVDLHMADLDMAFTLAGLRTQLGRGEAALEVLEGIELFQPAYPGLAELRAKLQEG
jgi:tetratricopeptide (TPR) repeat protein